VNESSQRFLFALRRNVMVFVLRSATGRKTGWDE